MANIFITKRYFYYMRYESKHLIVRSKHLYDCSADTKYKASRVIQRPGRYHRCTDRKILWKKYHELHWNLRAAGYHSLSSGRKGKVLRVNGFVSRARRNARKILTRQPGLCRVSEDTRETERDWEWNDKDLVLCACANNAACITTWRTESFIIVRLILSSIIDFGEKK